MPGKFEAPRGGKKNNSRGGKRHSGAYGRRRRSPLLPILLIVLALAVGGLAAWRLLLSESTAPTEPSVSAPSTESTTEATTEPTTEPPTETTAPEPEHVVSTATISATGDLLMHSPIFNVAKQSDGTYDFDFIFRYISSYVESADYAVANLETTLAGSSRAYSGFPMFNCPDEIAYDAAEAGFDMLLTANNHSFDTGADGYTRTLEVVHAAGLESLGTMASADDPKYVIEEINGIKVGMICYTYETSDGTGSYPSLNGLPMYGMTYENVNCFRNSDPGSMYTEVAQYLAEMQEAGVEATIMFIHWGVEYQLTENATQDAIAQQLCDLGIDVIIGGHPHVVQPMELLTSTVDETHKTVCLYSMGNAVSNQRLGNISTVSTAHTEDGVLFSVTFSKYSDGTVYLESVSLMPTWVYLNTEYIILPLDIEIEDQWGELYEINDYTVTAAKNSYARTMAIVEEGLTECQEYLAQAKVEREEAYLAAVS